MKKKEDVTENLSRVRRQLGAPGRWPGLSLSNSRRPPQTDELETKKRRKETDRKRQKRKDNSASVQRGGWIQLSGPPTLRGSS